MKTSDFYYNLPKELIAQTPVKIRSASRLLVYEREAQAVHDNVFTDIADYIRPGDALVRNITRVIPARLVGKREGTGGTMEFLLLKRLADGRFEALVCPARRAKPGQTYRINDELSITVNEPTDAGGRVLTLHYEGIFEQVLDRAGETPLPPYITERTSEPGQYQTVYAKINGSAAAPTAGLHFTHELLGELKRRGVVIVDILLHVGLGTFRPVSAENIEDHHMHSEYFEVSAQAAKEINAVRKKGGRIFAVGTTTCRTLESVADGHGIIHPMHGNTDIFITPGYRFKAVDALITNFHLPESTLLMLVSAFCSKEEIFSVYAHAIKEKYRFFSFGDAMLIL